MSRYRRKVEYSVNLRPRPKRSGKRLLGVAVVLLVASASYAAQQRGNQAAQDARLSAELLKLRSAATYPTLSSQQVQVIVQFKQRPNALHEQLMARVGGHRVHRLDAIRGGVYNIPLSALATLAQNPDVAYISPNRPVSVANDFSEATVGANVAQSYGWNGAGITVAVIDSGINDHPDLHDPVTGLSRVVYSQSFVPGTDATDGYGHGTHVAGIIAGNGSQSNHMFYGVAPNVNLINLKVLDSTGAGQDSYVIAAIQTAIALKSTYNIRVINLSLGRGVYESFTQDPLDQAVEAAWQAGIVVVAAAGNWGRDNSLGTSGYGMIGVPGNDPYVITVGAMNTRGTSYKGDDILTTYTSKGPTLLDHIVKPDIVAPGNRITSLLAKGSTLDTMLPGNEVSPTVYGASMYAPRMYFVLSGTSMATPMVSGAAVLLLQQDPTLTPDTIKARLMKTADKTFPTVTYIFDFTTWSFIPEYYDLFSVGAGYLNVTSALANNDIAQGAALSPVAVRNPDGSVVLQSNLSAVFGNSMIWSNSVIWGSSVIWGNSVVWGNTVLSGNTVIWGNSVVWDDTTVAGNSVIWGTSVIWGSSVDGATALSVDGAGDDDSQQ